MCQKLLKYFNISKIPGNKFENITHFAVSKTVSIDVYFVVVDDDAFKNQETGQPILGIDQGGHEAEMGSQNFGHGFAKSSF